MEFKVTHVPVERHHLLLWHNVHSVIQHTLHMFHCLSSIFSLVNTVKRYLKTEPNTSERFFLEQQNYFPFALILYYNDTLLAYMLATFSHPIRSKAKPTNPDLLVFPRLLSATCVTIEF